MIVRLIREVNSTNGSGPFNGQFALQRALRAYAPPWLKIGGTIQRDELPWFWCWLDAAAACACASEGRPFVIGPNILFHESGKPCQFAYERQLIAAPSCRLSFTESAWYADLIRAHMPPDSATPLVLWPYPIDPLPSPQTDAAACSRDLLIYAKTGLVERLGLLGRAFTTHNCRLLVYGHYTRPELLDAARECRAALYLSDNDRGPLALAEILLCGCPAVGVSRGAPWIVDGRNGVLVDCFHSNTILPAIDRAARLDRMAVANHAASLFDRRDIVRTIAQALDAARHPPAPKTPRVPTPARSRSRRSGWGPRL